VSGHEIDGHENSGHEIARHENDGYKIVKQKKYRLKINYITMQCAFFFKTMAEHNL